MKCPYCNEELELEITLKPVPVDEEFKKQSISAMEGLIQIQADLAPVMGGMVRNMAKMQLKWISRYIENIGAMPVIFQTCKKCDAVINTELFLNIGSMLGANK